jgi:hypothetical protein
MTPQQRFNLSLIGIALALIFILLSDLPALVQAEGSDLPPRPTPATATPMPGATPTATRSRHKKKASRPIGAYIRLQISGVVSGGWTMVQWQDAQGAWHDVPGWQGSLEAGTKIWWVAPADFSTGPFRWVMYEQHGGRQIAASEPFQLPAQPRDTVVVPLTDGP